MIFNKSVTTILKNNPKRVVVASFFIIFGVIVLVFFQVVNGGFTGQLSNLNSSASSGTLLLEDSIGTNNCLSSTNLTGSINTNQTNCSGYLLSQTIGSNTVSLTNTGSLSPTNANISTVDTCGVQEFADITGNNNTGLASGNITFEQPGPYTNSYSVGFNGSNGFGETLLGPPTTFYTSPGPQTFSIAAWFKSTTNGSIIGFSNSQTDTGQSSWDRQLWIDPTGHLVFGLYPNGIYELKSPNAYNNGNWHFAVVTVAPVNAAKATVKMFIDGAKVAGFNKDETLPGSAKGNPAQVYGGWWHLGWSNAGQGWPDSPTNSFFTGSLSDVTIYPKVVTLANITTLYAQTSETNFITAADLLTPNSFWSMQDTGTNLYTGSIGASNPTFLDESNNPGTNTGNGIGTFSLDPNGVLGSPATLFNGTSYIQTSTGPPTAFYSSPGPQTFSIAAWFKTTTSGSIIGFSNSQTDTGQSSWDRQLWIDPTGHLVFGLYPNGIYELKSPNTYNDGNWHYVVVTVEPVNATNATVQMYVDGNLVAGSTNDETLPGSAGGNPAQVYGGWWHLGWSNAGQGWPDSPTNSFFTGSLSDITIFSSVLSTANDSQLYAQTSQVNYLNAVRGTVASSNSFWPLTAVVNSNIPCNYIGLTISGSSSCIYPNYSGSCPSTPIAAGLFINEPIPTTLGSLVFTTGLVTNPPPTCLNLHVSVGFQIETQNGGFYATLNHLYGYVLL